MQNLLIAFAWLSAMCTAPAIAAPFPPLPFDDMLFPRTILQAPHSGNAGFPSGENYFGVDDEPALPDMTENRLFPADESIHDFMVLRESPTDLTLSPPGHFHTGVALAEHRDPTRRQFVRTLARGASTAVLTLRPSLELFIWLLAGLGLTGFMTRRRTISEKFA